VLEISPSLMSVTRCFGTAAALDRVPSEGAVAARIARDELWLIGPPSGSDSVAARAAAFLRTADPEALVTDHTEAWAAWRLAASDPAAVAARLVDFALPTGPAFAQGAAMHLPAKLLLRPRGLYVIVPVQLGHHVPVRVTEACADLGPVIGPAAEFVP
jgi:hypothetical protein